MVSLGVLQSKDMTKKVSVLLIILLSSFTGFSKNGSGNQFPCNVDYFNMQGKLFQHSLEKTNDSLSGKEILELRDETGITLWYSRYFYKDICITGICNMAKFRIFWDAAGNYLGYQPSDKMPLTKSDHVEFTPDDYIKLHEILSDSTSVLKHLSQENLTLEVDGVERSIFKVDGLSGATPPSLSGHVIKDAVYTCYTLWHTVYGETKSLIAELIKDKINTDYIRLLINGPISQKKLALELVKKHPFLFESFVFEFAQMAASRDKELASAAISVIPFTYLNESKNQVQLIQLIHGVQPEIKNEIIYKLEAVEYLSIQALVLLLEKYMEGEVGGLNHIYQIIAHQAEKKPEIMLNHQLNNSIKNLASSSDIYISNLTDKHFGKYYKRRLLQQ